MTENENFKIGFLNIKDIGEEGDLRGAMLVTDGSTYPIELRYSDPVRATMLEKLTFGVTLKDGITIDRVARPLLESFDNKPSIIFIKDESFLNNPTGSSPLKSIASALESWSATANMSAEALPLDITCTFSLAMLHVNCKADPKAPLLFTSLAIV